MKGEAQGNQEALVQRIIAGLLEGTKDFYGLWQQDLPLVAKALKGRVAEILSASNDEFGLIFYFGELIVSDGRQIDERQAQDITQFIKTIGPEILHSLKQQKHYFVKTILKFSDELGKEFLLQNLGNFLEGGGVAG